MKQYPREEKADHILDRLSIKEYEIRLRKESLFQESAVTKRKPPAMRAVSLPLLILKNLFLLCAVCLFSIGESFTYLPMKKKQLQLEMPPGMSTESLFPVEDCC